MSANDKILNFFLSCAAAGLIAFAGLLVFTGAEVDKINLHLIGACLMLLLRKI